MTAAVPVPEHAKALPRRTHVQPAASRSRFVFILSPERSGSTMLSAMLGGHSRVVAPAELHMLRYATVAAWRRAYPAAATSLETLLQASDLEPGSIADGESPASLYRRIQRRVPAGTLLVDKTPAYARYLEALEAAESVRPLYVWLIRHPLGVAASRVNGVWSRRPTENTRWMPWLKYPAWWMRESFRYRTGRSVRAFAEDWADVHGRLRAFLQDVDQDRVIRVHYEDLVRRPVPALRSLCDFLDLDPEPAMLDPRGNAPKNLRWGVGDENLLRHEGIEATRAEAWRKSWGEDLLSGRVRLLARALGVRIGDDDAAETAEEPQTPGGWMVAAHPRRA